ncbi:ATP-binding protein [Virgibacillus kekensis]|uniref:histidine kinase n=1 Tax=Virgibacillus kekensis TaxID=202261 RepID=A0ABV9DJ27_9BACI
MTKKKTDVSIQTKIMGLVIALILFIIISLLGIFVYFDVKHEYKNAGNVSLQTAKMISFMPKVREDMEKPLPSQELQHIVERIRDQVEAKFIVITDREGKVLTHPNRGRIGKKIPMQGSNYKAVVFGGYYILKSNEIIGPSLTGKAPIFNERGHILGVVTVGYLIEDIKQNILSRVRNILLFAAIIIVIGVFASVSLARNIRKDTLGLEPKEISSLYRDRSTILSSIDEGIIAIDPDCRITLLNDAAASIFNLNHEEACNGKPIETLLPNIECRSILAKREKVVNIETTLVDKTVIINVMPVLDNGRVFGGVIALRDKTEIQETVNTLSEVRRYSEDLRAQTHEFTNKLYLLSGLMQLGYYEDATKLIQSEIETNDMNNRTVFEQIKDPKVQAILLGKIGKASEKKVNFRIDQNSSLEILPTHIKTDQLTTIIGNLIDNAFEEVFKKAEKHVSFFTLDLGDDIIFEITDNGEGINEERVSSIFEKGFSTKGSSNRGYGLANVKKNVNELNGDIQVSRTEEETLFTVYLPKKIH